MIVENLCVIPPLGTGQVYPMGNLAMHGTLMPPSVVYDLYILEGAVDACAQRGPYQMKEL